MLRVRGYRRGVLRRIGILGCAVCIPFLWLCAQAGVAGIELTSPVIVSGGSLLAGYSILATLVVAVQVAARGLRRRDKRRNPAGTSYLGILADLTLLSSFILLAVGIAGAVDFSRWSADLARIGGCLLFTALIALFAGEAGQLADSLPEYDEAERLQLLREADEVLRMIPGVSPKAPERLYMLQRAIVFGLVPVLAAWWAGGAVGAEAWAATLFVLPAEAAAFVGFRTIRFSLPMLYRGQFGTLIAVAAGAALPVVLFGVVSTLPHSNDAGTYRNLLAYACAVLVPLLGPTIFSFPVNGTQSLRGFVVQSVANVWERERERLEKRGAPAPPRPKSIAVAAGILLFPPLGVLIAVRWLQSSREPAKDPAEADGSPS